jgi:hypothetical protein
MVCGSGGGGGAGARLRGATDDAAAHGRRYTVVLQIVLPSRCFTCRKPRVFWVFSDDLLGANTSSQGSPNGLLADKAPIHRDRDGFIAKTKPCLPRPASIITSHHRPTAHGGATDDAAAHGRRYRATRPLPYKYLALTVTDRFGPTVGWKL